MKNYHSFSEISADLKAGNITCENLVNHYLSNIEKNSDLNVFLTVYKEEALDKAKEIDSKIKEGTAGKLAGMVIGLKDVLCYKDHPLQASSKILEDFSSVFNGTAVERLLEEDAIIIGRQNCDEFAMGSSNENSAFGPVKNAANKDKVPGGSSGGSAVSVQADMCQVALGSDTGGSVRQPAAFCGVVGLKPTYSRISRYGLIAYASSFDTIGIFSKSISDNALILETIAGPDEFDSTVSQKEVPPYSTSLKFDKKVKIAYLESGVNHEGVSGSIKKQTQAAIDKLKNEGHTVESVSFSYLDYILPAYYILTMAEASSNLSRYDGVKYGYRSGNATDLLSMYKLSRTEGFGEEVKKRIMLGTFVLSAGYYDAYYNKAQKVRRLIREETLSFLKTYDFIILPTTPTTAFNIGGHEKDSLAMYLEDLFTVQASLSGIPAISVPNGADEDGLPIGLQILSGSFKEADMYAFADYFLNLN